MNPLRFVPIVRTRPRPAPAGWWDRLLRNRRDPASRVVLLGDVLMNVSDWWHTIYHRVPAGTEAYFKRDSAGRLESMEYRRE